MENIDDDPDYEGNGDPHDQVVRLEALIEELTVKIESCRKFILVSRIATSGGGVVLFAMFFGVMRFDLGRPQLRRGNAAGARGRPAARRFRWRASRINCRRRHGRSVTSTLPSPCCRSCGAHSPIFRSGWIAEQMSIQHEAEREPYLEGFRRAGLD